MPPKKAKKTKKQLEEEKSNFNQPHIDPNNIELLLIFLACRET